MKNYLFAGKGLHILAGGQFGSEGKGVLASWLATEAILQHHPFSGCITSAGPNSGHTSWFDGRQIVLKQLPTFAVHMHLRGQTIPVYFSAGAIIDPEILVKEHAQFPDIPVFIHPCAAVVSSIDKEEERNPISSIYKTASTQSGTGAAIMRKISRLPDAVYNNNAIRMFPYFWDILNVGTEPYFMEISQGFSLGLNDPMFYPKVTSRECTFMQGMADARIAYKHFARGYLCFRTFPIRVGNVDKYSSGEWYPDQEERTWDEIGVPAELTTVTRRIRRVATWSWQQFDDAVSVNAPTHVFINFMNYLDKDAALWFKEKHDGRQLIHDYDLLYGFGPTSRDIEHPYTSGTIDISGRYPPVHSSDAVQAEDERLQGSVGAPKPEGFDSKNEP